MNYTLNPFALVNETPDGFMICVSDRHRVVLPAQSRELVDELIRGTPMTPDELGRHISTRRLNELLGKNILLNGNAPPVDGRYSRQLGFFSLTTPDYRLHQGALARAHAVLLGAGGVGSHVAWNLAAMGVGRITIVDFDEVEESNLNRQLYTPADIGLPKVDKLCEQLRAFNPDIEVRPVPMRITSMADIAGLIADATVLVKAIDTPVEATSWANEACVNAAVPFVNGGFLEETGIIGPTYIPGRSLCFACISPIGMQRLHGKGPTFAPLVTLVSSMLALCAFKIIVGATEEIVDKFFTFDTRTAAMEAVPVQSRQACGLCGHPPTPVESPRTTMHPRLWTYRGTIVALMLVGAAILAIGHDRFTGVLMLAVFFASMPVLDVIVGGDARRFRREAFVITCIYVTTNMLFAMIARFWQGRASLFHISIGGIFTFVQSAIGLIDITVVMITVLFAIAVLFIACMKKLNNSTESWFA